MWFSLLGKVLFALQVRGRLVPLLVRERLGVVLLVRKTGCTFRVRERFVSAFWIRE